MKQQQKVRITEQHERDMDRIQELCMMDDVFMSKVLENLECTELVLIDIIRKLENSLWMVHISYM